MSVEACGVAERPERCERCRYAGAIAGQGVMTCRRYPSAGAGGWPHVGAVDWCGEWVAVPVSERLKRAADGAPTDKAAGTGMKLYAWRPDGHGQLSFFVMADSEQAARAAVDAAVERILREGRRYDVDGWGSDYYELSVYAAGEVAEHYND